MAWRKKLDQLLSQFAEVEAQLQNSDLPHTEIARLGKERAELSDVVDKINTLKTAESQLVESEALLTDPDMKDLAIEEVGRLRKMVPELEQEIMLALVPKDAADERNAILELRAGTGGEEAALFASELFTMYQRYAAIQGWRFEILEISGADQGGFKEASAMVTGYNVFARMKFETGVHRVQRVPKTESGGRIHTSAATVAVLPEAEEVDVVLEDKDIRIDVMRASGPGGQSVNTTDSAVRITHLPTGIMVYMQEEKSQIKNKAKGLKILRARLYEAERERLADERAAHRKSQVGSGDRSERIRTYNFPQGRVTDHRINLTLYNIERVMVGDDLGDFIEALMANDQTERLSQLGDTA